MSAQNRVRIRVPEESRNDHRQSGATEVQATPPSPRGAKITPVYVERDGSSTSAHGDAQMLAAAPETANQDPVVPDAVGNANISPIDAQAGAEAGPASDKCAACETGAAPGDTPAAPTTAAESEGVAVNARSAESSNLPTAKTELQLAIDGCEALTGKSRKMVREKWNSEAAPILQASLRLMAAYNAAPDTERELVRGYLKTRLNLGRKPNAGNLALVAVYLCVSTADWVQTEPQRKHWSRFATVVNLAASKPVSPDEAFGWLEDRTLTGLLAEWRGRPAAAACKSKRKRPVTVPKEYGSLTTALSGDSKYRQLAIAELEKANNMVTQAMARDAKSSSMHGLPDA